MNIALISRSLSPPAVSLFVAKRGYGKTTLVKLLLREIPKWVVFDPNYEYEGGVVCYYFSDLKLLLKSGEPKIIYRPLKTGAGAFEYFCACVFFLARDYLVVIDEIHRFMPSSGTGKYSEKLVAQGRHKNLGIMGCCHRPLGVNKLFMSQIDFFFVGKVTIPNDVKYWRDYLPPQVMDHVPKLERYWFAYWNDREESLLLVDSMGHLKSSGEKK